MCALYLSLKDLDHQCWWHYQVEVERGKAKTIVLQNMSLFMDRGSYKNILTNEVPLETLFIKLVKYQAQRLPGVVILHRICYWWTCNLYHHFSGILTHFGKVFLDRPPNLISVGKGNFGSFFHFRIQMSRAALEKDDFFSDFFKFWSQHFVLGWSIVLA